MTIHVGLSASVTVGIGKVPVLESWLSIALINIVPSLLILTGFVIIIWSKRRVLFLEIGSMQIRFLYFSHMTITGNVTCAITIETQNFIVYRPEFVSSSVSGSVLWWAVLCSVPLYTVGAWSPVVVVLSVVTLRNVMAVVPAVSTLNFRVYNVKVLVFHTCPLLL